MRLKRKDELRNDAVRIALPGGLTRKQVTDDCRDRISTLNEWIMAHRSTDAVPQEDLSLAQEKVRLRQEVGNLNEARHVLE